MGDTVNQRAEVRKLVKLPPLRTLDIAKWLLPLPHPLPSQLSSPFDFGEVGAEPQRQVTMSIKTPKTFWEEEMVNIPNRACVPCRAHHSGCSGGRPCVRCVIGGRQCYDSEVRFDPSSLNSAFDSSSSFPRSSDNGHRLAQDAPRCSNLCPGSHFRRSPFSKPSWTARIPTSLTPLAPPLSPPDPSLIPPSTNIAASSPSINQTDTTRF
ncbi:hypothetical protein T439DRAFT_57022 [Meredithblackwellia eburnea MCA 4105]